MNGILHRISQIVDNEGITITALEKNIGASKGVLSRALAKGSDIQSKWVQSIVENYHQYDAGWLLTGKGDMLKTDVDQKSSNVLSEINKKEIETRPRIPMDAAAGSLSTALNGVTNNDCEQLPVIKAFARYDFTIFARGDSMFPEYHSGDELACLFIKNTSFVQWGRVHVLDTAQGVVLKRIFDNGEHILCRSLNPDYSEFTIHKSEVYNIALVIGLIRRY